MIVRIARKEFTEMVRDGRFRWASGIVLVLLLASLAMGWKHYREVEAQHQAAKASTRRQWVHQGTKNPHAAAHYGVYAFKPKMPLTFVDQGLDPYLGVAVWLEAHYQNPFRYRPAEDATALQRFGELTAATVLQLLIPLLIILLSFSAFAGEREQGTLRQLLSLGVKRRDLALGKAFGITSALGVLLLPATAIGVMALGLASGSSSMQASLSRFAIMMVAYLLYFGAFIGLSLAASAKAPSSRLALVALLAFWIINGLVVPRAAADVAERWYRTPNANEFWRAVNQDMIQGINAHNPNDKRQEAMKKQLLKQYGVDKLENLPVNFAGIALQAGEEHGNQVFDKHYSQLWNIYERQERVHKLGSMIAPLLAIRSLSMGLSGTDFAQHRHFAAAAEQYRRQLIKMMNENMAYHSTTRDGFGYSADQKLWEQVPDFQYTAPELGWVLRQQVLSIGALGLWFALVGVGAVIAAIKINV